MIEPSSSKSKTIMRYKTLYQILFDITKNVIFNHTYKK